MNDSEKRIIGIDPGYGRVGWGVIEGSKSKWSYVAYGCIETDAEKTFVARLIEISDELKRIIRDFEPDSAAVEELFFHKNAKTAMAVAQARGVIILTLSESKLDIQEFTPLEIKQALTGYGRADKSQVQRLIEIELGMKSLAREDDAADALAVALTAGFSTWHNSL